MKVLKFHSRRPAMDILAGSTSSPVYIKGHGGVWLPCIRVVEDRLTQVPGGNFLVNGDHTHKRRWRVKS